MKRTVFAMSACVIGFCAAVLLADPPSEPSAAAASKPEAGPVLNHTVKNIDGQEVNLADYKGQVLLVVNVASACGLTKQYKDLQALHEQYKEQGLKVLGFPSNDFGGQEPGTESQIREFCTKNYGVTFDMFSKVTVLGPDKDPFFAQLTDPSRKDGFGGDITWNFAKFLIDRNGRLVARFDPKVNPMDPKVIEAIEQALRTPAGA